VASNLRVCAGADHRPEAQKPQALAAGEFPTWSGLPEASAPAEAAHEPKAPVAKPTTAKRVTTTSPATKATPKRTPAKTPAKRATAKATTAKPTTAKRTTAKSTA